MDDKNKKQMKAKGRGGKRPGSGRKPMPDAKNRVFVTVFLRKETIAALRALAGSHYIGGVLQDHLDRFPPTPDSVRKRVRPVLSPEEKEKRRQAKLSPIDRRWDRVLDKMFAKKKSKATK